MLYPCLGKVQHDILLWGTRCTMSLGSPQAMHVDSLHDSAVFCCHLAKGKGIYVINIFCSRGINNNSILGEEDEQSPLQALRNASVHVKLINIVA